MITREFKAFCNRWLEKADSQDENKLNDIFDKFLALFIVYNALYSKVTESLFYSREISKDDNTKSDFFCATKIIPRYLTHKELAKTFKEDEKVSAAIKEIKKYVGNTEEDICFDICFRFDRSQGRFIADKQQENKLIAKATSNNEEESIVALLTIIYKIRCNMFHGQKALIEKQRCLIEPTIVVIRKIIDLTLDKLEKS